MIIKPKEYQINQPKKGERKKKQIESLKKVHEMKNKNRKVGKSNFVFIVKAARNTVVSI